MRSLWKRLRKPNSASPALSDAELILSEMASGRWDIQSGPAAGSAPKSHYWPGNPAAQLEQLDKNLAYRAGAVGTARRLGRDLH